MTDRQIRWFLAVYETLNFSVAARKLFLTQPTLSYQIRNLEQELGAPLFMRTTSHVELTDVGRQFAQFALESHKLYLKLQASISASRPPEKLVLQAPATMIARDPLYHDLLFAFRQKLPECELEVRPDTHEKSLAQKLTNGINALICINQQDLSEDVDLQVLFNTRCFLLCGPDTPFPAHKISSRQLSGYTICYEPCDSLLADTVRSRLCDPSIQWRKVSNFEKEYPNLLSGRCLFFSPVCAPVFPKEWYRELLMDRPLGPTCLFTRSNDARPSIKILKELTVLEHTRAIADGRLAGAEPEI